MTATFNAISLAGWRRAIAEMYAQVRATGEEGAAQASDAFRAGRERLFREHPDSPIPEHERARWAGTAWFRYDPALRTMAIAKPVARPSTFEIALASDGVTRCTRVATLEFALREKPSMLTLYWFEGYGGGLWLPFADATNGASTYGGGRYLYDTIKGADLGASETRFVLDFNFAYNPSCAYDERWSCPLPPAENRLPFAVEAGERMRR